ncbi:MAG: pseudouridine synthase [Ruthenibacterium sp.]
MRLDQYTATAAQKSRTEVRKDILHGLVTVNGAVCKKAAAQVTENSAVTLNGTMLTLQKYVYIMLDKPLGVVSAAADKNDTTVIDLVGRAYPRRNLFPAGRLDKASTGFVLITDDGAFAHEILAPKHHVAKTYEILLDTPLTQEMTDGFAAGVKLADGEVMKPAIAVPFGENPCSATVVISQGVYHQIKRMFGVFDAGVEALRRTAIGGLKLDATLGAGGFKELSQEDLAQMQQQDSQSVFKTNTGVL